MDLIAYALMKKNSGGGGGGSVEPIIPTIGDNGNWFINGIDTGFKAVADDKVEVDGILKVDSTNKKISVVKDDVETIISEYATNIDLNSISELFE